MSGICSASRKPSAWDPGAYGMNQLFHRVIVVSGACALVVLSGCGGHGAGATGSVDSPVLEYRPVGADAQTIFSEPPLEPASDRRLASGAPGPAYWQQKADYWIEASLDEAARKVTGKERVRYENHSPHELSFVW